MKISDTHNLININKNYILNIEEKINKNRDEINNILHQDWPLDLLYMRLHMLRYQNEVLIKKVNTIKLKNEQLITQYKSMVFITMP